MNNRMKELRKAMKLSQEEFGKLIGISKSGVSDIESGRRNVTDQHIIMLETKGVNSEWLRSGIGTMFIPKTKDEEISEMLADIQKAGEDSFKHRLISALSKLDEEGWDNLEKLLDMIYKK